ncbi:MAG TPA: hypothetical protein ENK19_07455, partial [Acidobacteria bacterium]|nr:hypothetical protein [Acidobacteriota bacterium]
MAGSEPRLVLVGSSDEYLAQEALQEEVAAIQQIMGDAAVIELEAGVSPQRVAEEIVSGSLFDPRRILVLRDVGPWLDAPVPVGSSGRVPAADPSPLVSTLEHDLPEDVALVMGAWCGAKPRGPLVEL